jgi:acyl-CoA reductase-like NAD-dependent aldehyde dehydrogenase
LKAAEDAPLGVLLLAKVCQELLQPGILNALSGLGKECGAPLASHPMISKLSFTGSTEVGQAHHASLTGNTTKVKPVQEKDSVTSCAAS